MFQNLFTITSVYIFLVKIRNVKVFMKMGNNYFSRVITQIVVQKNILTGNILLKKLKISKIKKMNQKIKEKYRNIIIKIMYIFLYISINLFYGFYRKNYLKTRSDRSNNNLYLL